MGTIKRGEIDQWGEFDHITRTYFAITHNAIKCLLLSSILCLILQAICSSIF